ncbi:hypothetical protein VTI74DRAFT_11054 [Chaetomium olivicolor]
MLMVLVTLPWEMGDGPRKEQVLRRNGLCYLYGLGWESNGCYSTVKDSTRSGVWFISIVWTVRVQDIND